MKNIIKNTTHLHVVTVFFSLLFLGFEAFAAGPQMSYHGRIVDSTTNIGVFGSVDFKIQVRTPTTAGDNCLMYEETQTKTIVNGVFVLGINNGTGTRTDSSGYSIEQIFSNKNTFGAFSLAGSACSSTSPYSYSPSATDTRRVVISFHDSTMAPGVYEPLPTQTVAYVPSAIESLNVGGFPVDALMRVVTAGGTPDNVSPLSNAQYNELMNIVGGTSTQYLLSGNPAVGFTGALAGDVTGTQSTTLVSRIRGTSVSAVAPAPGEVLKFNGAAWAPAPDNDSLGTVTNVSSSNGYLTVTNGSLTPSLTLNVGTTAGTVAAGNDPRLTGSLQAGSTASGDLTGTYPGPTVATVGGKTAAQINTSVNDTLAATPSVTAGAIVKRDGSGNSSFVTAQATNFSGRNVYLFDGANTNSIRIMSPNTFSADYTLTLPGDAGSAGFVLKTNGAGVLTWDSPTAGSVTSVTGAAPIVSSGGGAPIISILQSSATGDGYLSSSDWTTFNNKLSTGLATGQVWVGSAGAIATPQYLGIANIRSTVAGNWFQAAGACPTGQSLSYDSVNDIVTCQAYAITSGQVTGALGFTPASNSLPSGQVLIGNVANVATPQTISGDASISMDGTVTVNANAITNGKIANSAVTNAKINDVAWSKVTSTPTTIAGYGIVDAILTNAGGVTTMQAGPNASKPAAGSAGRIYITTDSGEIYRDDGTTWVKVGSALGSGGTVTSVTAAPPISVINGTTTPILSMAQATAVSAGYVTSQDWTVFSNKLTSVLPSTQIFVGSAGNAATAVSVSGDASISNSGMVTLTNSPATRTNLGLGSSAVLNAPSSGNAAVGEVVKGDDTRLTDARIPTGAASGDLAGTYPNPVLTTTGVGAGTYKSVTVDTKGRVTGGTNPTTLGGFGITDGVQNNGVGPTAVVTALAAGTFATRPAAGVAGHIYFATDTQQIFRDNGATWDVIASNTGSGGTVTSITAGTGLTGGTITGVGTIGLGTELTGVNSLATTGLVRRTGAGTYSAGVIGLAVASGDITGTLAIANGGTGATTQAGAINNLLPTQVLQNGKVLQTDGTNVSWAPTTNGTVTSVSVAPPLSVINPNTTPILSLSQADNATAGYLTSQDWTMFNAKVDGTLTSANIFVGNGSNLAQGRVLSGDASITNLGILTINNGAINNAKISDVAWSKVTATPTTVAGYGITDATTNVLTSGNIFVGNSSNLSQSRVLSGDASISNSGVLTLTNSAATRTNLGLGGAAVLNVGTGAGTVAAGDDARIVGAFQGATALSGDLTGTLPNPTLQVIGAGGTGSKITYDTKGRVISSTNINSTDVTTALGYTPSSNALTSANIFVGNASNIAQGQVLSGDASISNTGILSLVNTGVTAASYGTTSQVPQFSVDAKGRITTVTNVTINDTSKLPLNGGTMTGAIAMGGNNITGSGNIMMATNKSFGLTNLTDAEELALVATPLTAADKGRTWYNAQTNAMRYWDGLTVKTLGAVGSAITSLNGLNGTSQTFATGTSGSDFGISSVGTVHTFNIPNASAAARGALSSADWTTFNSKLSTTLNNGQMWLGSAGNVATAVTMSGDAAISNTGIVTLNTVPLSKGGTGAVTQAAAINNLLPSQVVQTGKFLQTDGTNVSWVNTTNGTVTNVSVAPPLSVINPNTTPIISLAQADGFTAGYVTSQDWTAFNSKLNGTLTSANIFVGNGSNLAQGRVLSGDATISNLGILTINNGAINNAKISDVAWGKVTATPTTIAGYGITDAVSNSLTSGNIFVGNATNLAQARVMSGDASISNAGVLTLTNSAATRANLGLGGAAVLNVGTGAGTVAAGDDARLVGAFQGATALSGDLTGTLPNPTLKAIGAGGTGSKITYDTKGRVISSTNIGSSDVTAALGYTPASSVLTSANIFVGNASNIAEGRALSGDASISNTGILTLSTVSISKGGTGAVTQAAAINNLLPSQVVQTGKFLQTDGTNVSWVNTTNGTVTNVSVAPPLSVLNPNTTPIISLAEADALNAGYLTSQDWTSFNSKLNSTLTSANIFVGNGSNLAQGRVLSGDATISNLGILTINNGAINNAKISDVAWAKVTTTPTTLAGYGITDGASSSLASGSIFVGNGSNLAQARVMSGDGAISATGTLTLTNSAATRTNLGLGGAAVLNVGSGAGTVAAGDDARIVGAFQSATAISGDLTGTLPNPTLKAIGAGGTGSKITYDTKGRVISSTNINSTDVTTALGYTPSSASLTSANIFVGNASNIAEGRALTGDAAISNTGALTFNTVATPGTFAKVTFNAKGLVTSGSALASSDVTTALGYTPSSASLTSANIFIGNASNIAQGQVLSGDATISNAGILTLNTVPVSKGGTGAVTQAGAINNLLPTQVLQTGKFLQTDGTNVSWVTATNGTVTNISVAPPLSILNPSTTPIISLAEADALNAGYLTSQDWTSFNSKLNSTLTSANIFVGNGSNLAQGRVLSGDATISNLGILTIGAGAINNAKISDVAWSKVTATPTTLAGYGITDGASSSLTSGNIFVGNGSNLAQSRLMSGDASISNTGLVTLTNSAGTRTNLGLGGAAVLNVGTGAGTVAAGDDARIVGAFQSATAISGDLTGTLPNPTLKAIGAGGTGSKITYDTKGRVISSTNINSTDVTTALGYTPSSASLTSANIFVGNASNIAEGRVLSGDATISNLGILAINNGAITNAKINDVAWAKVTTTPTTLAGYGITDAASNSLTSGSIFVGNATNLAQARVMSGDGSISATGALTLTNSAATRTNLGLGGAAVLNVGTGAGTVAAGDDARIVGAFQSATAISGDLTGTLPNPTLKAIGAGGTGSKITYDTKGRVIASTNINSTDVTTALGYTPSSASLTSANIFVGNASNIAEGRALSGDASISNTGMLTFNTVATPGTFAKVTFNAKGLVTSGSALASSDVTTALGYTPSSASLTSANIFIGNASNIAQGQVLSGDASITNAGILSLNTVATPGTFSKVTFNAKGLVTSGAALASSDVTTALGYTPSSASLTSANIFVGNASNIAEGRALTGDAAISNTGALTFNTVATPGTFSKVTFNAKGLVTSGAALASSDVTTALGYTPSSATLASGSIFVGNASNVATAVTMAGEVTINNAGTATITNAAITTPKLFANPGVNRLIATDSSTGATLAPFSCSLNQILNWTASGWACASVVPANFGTQTANLVFAGPSSGGAATPSFRSLVSSDVSAAAFVPGGNSFGGATSIGTNDASTLTVKTNNTARVTVDTSGGVQVSGQAWSAVQTSVVATTLTWDANTGNVMRWSNAATTTVNVHNMKPGAAYMLVVNSAATNALTMNCFSDAGVTSLPSGFVPANGTRVAGTLNKTVYTVMSDGANCLVTWITGY